MKSTISYLRLDVYKKAQANDVTCTQILEYCQDGWPNKSQLDPMLKQYWDAQGELTEEDAWTTHVQTDNRGPNVTSN